MTYEQFLSWLLLKNSKKVISVQVASCLNLVALGSRDSGLLSGKRHLQGIISPTRSWSESTEETKRLNLAVRKLFYFNFHAFRRSGLRGLKTTLQQFSFLLIPAKMVALVLYLNIFISSFNHWHEVGCNYPVLWHCHYTFY